MIRQTIAFLLAILILCAPAFAVDAVSSATVDIDTLPEMAAHEGASTLVIYFSTDDTVKAVALTAANALNADVFEVVPEVPYTKADLTYYTDCRADREQADDSARPGIAAWPGDMEQYDTVFIGYPIWHGKAPKILYTLVEGLNLTGKTIVPFCTSVSSPAGSSAVDLSRAASDMATWLDVTRISNGATAEQISAWAASQMIM